MLLFILKSAKDRRSGGEESLATGMWTAVSGASAQALQVETIANNLANADTLGFKKDAPVFREYLAVQEREPGPAQLQHRAIKDKDLYPLDGRDQAFVVTDGTYTNFRQGNLRVTHALLDVAMDGPGFIEVSTPSGVRYTRQGSLKLAMDGRLVTTEGYPVLSSQGAVAPEAARAPASDAAIAARFINLRDRGSNLSINDQGELYAGEDLVAKLSVVEFGDLNKLRKAGGQLFDNTDPANVSVAPVRTVVRQGVLETSNVNPVEEMTNLIKANRLYEQDLKAIKTYGELLGKEANDIGKI
ncbi:MAG: flagellar hook-basal body protein [Oligoflexia bacterium]|nr:flagellar hook-basal body protein [Oligoflexia bacterium]